ncbi:hypothetical protein EON81_07410 [bacterium]|nr:MAG: hypothetical protein EON81_07410 [bacterium]
MLITGMSGTGKSAVLAELARRGHEVVDTDYGNWIEEARLADGSVERLWREERIVLLLARRSLRSIFVAGCVANQREFYAGFNAIVLLSAPCEVILDRIASRTTNDYGKSAIEQERILDDIAFVEPLLRVRATAEIDTRIPLHEVADQLESIARLSV